MRELLNRHCALAETPESWAKETFLTQRLCVPPEWIHEAKAVRARMEGDKHKEALFLFKAGHWNQCHKLVVRHLASGESALLICFILLQTARAAAARAGVAGGLVTGRGRAVLLARGLEWLAVPQQLLLDAWCDNSLKGGCREGG